MKKYRKKPVVIEAQQWFSTDPQCADQLTGEALVDGVTYDPDTREPIIETLEGNMKVNEGDWIIKGVQGECYPCKPEIFEATYEPVT